MRQQPFNPEPDGTCRTIKANYYKVSRANFLHTNSFGATGVIEIEDDGDTRIVTHPR